MPRFFLAITPPEPLLSQIEAFRGRWGHPHHKVEPHVTVKPPFEWTREPEGFLTAARAACLKVRAFPARLGPPGRFARSGVLFLTVVSEDLSDLHLRVSADLAGLVPPEARPHEGGYHPHLTLASRRFGIDEAGLAQMEAEARAELSDLPPFTITALRCYRWQTDQGRWQTYRDVPLGT